MVLEVVLGKVIDVGLYDLRPVHFKSSDILRPPFNDPTVIFSL